jgi:hypothetical protein
MEMHAIESRIKSPDKQRRFDLLAIESRIKSPDKQRRFDFQNFVSEFPKLK